MSDLCITAEHLPGFGVVRCLCVQLTSDGQRPPRDYAVRWHTKHECTNTYNCRIVLITVHVVHSPCASSSGTLHSPTSGRRWPPSPLVEATRNQHWSCTLDAYWAPETARFPYVSSRELEMLMTWRRSLNWSTTLQWKVTAYTGVSTKFQADLK